MERERDRRIYHHLGHGRRVERKREKEREGGEDLLKNTATIIKGPPSIAKHVVGTCRMTVKGLLNILNESSSSGIKVITVTLTF